MKKFNLDIYKDYQQYFNLLDVLIKEKSSNKELFLEDLDISPSSYRRVKKDGNKIGETILKRLAKYFKYNLCDDSLIDEIEVKINNIYYDIYYKNYDNYFMYYQWINEMLNKNYIIFPIFKLFKLLMIINDQTNPNNIQNENYELYEDVKQYEYFFDSGLLEIMEILDVTFKEDIDDCFLSKRFINELSYNTLASRCTFMKRYLESIYFCEKAKEIYIKDENYKRVYFINLTLIANYNYLLKFENANILAEKQIKTLVATKNYELEYEYTMKIHMITYLGLKRYDEIILILEDKEEVTLTETICLLIAYYFTDKKKYNDFYNEMTEEDDEDDLGLIDCLQLLDDILKNNNRKRVIELDSFDINKCIIEILKKM